MKRSLTGIVVAISVALGSPGLAGATTSTWTIQPVPMPPGAASGDLAAVSCPSATICWATGLTGNSSGFVELWNGSTWSVQPVPVPAGATDFDLTGISCVSPATCMAVGWYINGSGESEMIAEHMQRSGPWRARTIQSAGGMLTAVSCASATSCTAVGEQAMGPFITVTLAEHWNGAGWTVQPTPVPSGSNFSLLEGISCATLADCTAVGFYYNSSNQAKTLAEQWTGTTWSIQPTANPPGQPAAVLDGVSCFTPTACTAIGLSGTEGVAGRWNGSTWTVAAIPPPAGGSIVGMPGISCPTANNCTAVGEYRSGSVRDRALAEHWTASGGWHKQPTASPAAHKGLKAISCSAAGTCTAVGFSGTPVLSTHQMLAERE